MSIFAEVTKSKCSQIHRYWYLGSRGRYVKAGLLYTISLLTTKPMVFQWPEAIFTKAIALMNGGHDFFFSIYDIKSGRLNVVEG